MKFVKNLWKKTLEAYKLYTWTFISVMLLNQLLFFGFCLNPVCIIAAMPHVLFITVVIGTLINKMETKSKETKRTNIHQNQPINNRAFKETLKSDTSLAKKTKAVKNLVKKPIPTQITRSEYLTKDQISKINGLVLDAINYDNNMRFTHKYSNRNGISYTSRTDHKKEISTKFRRSMRLKFIEKQSLRASNFKRNI